MEHPTFRSLTPVRHTSVSQDYWTDTERKNLLLIDEILLKYSACEYEEIFNLVKEDWELALLVPAIFTCTFYSQYTSELDKKIIVLLAMKKCSLSLPHMVRPCHLSDVFNDLRPGCRIPSGYQLEKDFADTLKLSMAEKPLSSRSPEETRRLLKSEAVVRLQYDKKLLSENNYIAKEHALNPTGMDDFLKTGELPEDDTKRRFLFIDLFQCYAAENGTKFKRGAPAENRIALLKSLLKEINIDGLDSSDDFNSALFKFGKDNLYFGEELNQFLLKYHKQSEITLYASLMRDPRGKIPLNDFIKNNPDLKVLTLNHFCSEHLAGEEKLELGGITQLTIQRCYLDKKGWQLILDAVERTSLHKFSVDTSFKFDGNHTTLFINDADSPELMKAILANKWLISGTIAWSGIKRTEMHDIHQKHLLNNKLALEAHKNIQLLKGYETVTLPNEIIQLISRLSFEGFYKDKDDLKK